jgi:alkanesulfonate monooxygenase SsuD/methylene tetrahydromethanopterin reductase-like flavin-dependent oxidoreductase (luciferase family)
MEPAVALPVAPTLRVRLGLRYDLRAGSGGVPALYRRILRHVFEAEARGVDLVWVSERPFTPGASIPAALPVCAALCAATTRIRIGAGPLNLPIHHPLRVAEDAATLDGLSKGRLELALGLGGSEDAFTGFGIATRGRGGRLEEGIALLRAAWTGHPIHFAGRHHRVSDVAVWPHVVQAGGPPLWIGANADAAVRRAAKLGTGLLATSVEAIRRYVAAWHEQPTPGSPRAGLEIAAGAALQPALCDTLGALAERQGLAGFDLVASAESDGRLLDERTFDALLGLRERLSRGGA